MRKLAAQSSSASSAYSRVVLDDSHDGCQGRSGEQDQVLSAKISCAKVDADTETVHGALLLEMVFLLFSSIGR